MLTLFLDRATGTLTSPGVGLGALTMHWQTATMANATIGAEIHQTLDIHGHLATQVTFDHDLRHFLAQGLDLGFCAVCRPMP